jgi:hypothetical protein
MNFESTLGAYIAVYSGVQPQAKIHRRRQESQLVPFDYIYVVL